VTTGDWPLPKGPSFLEAKRLAESASGPPLALLIGMSGTAEPLVPYIRAAAAERGRDARVSTLPFGTLAQSLREPPAPSVIEVLLLFPWDLVPEADWRTGVASVDPRGAVTEAEREVARLVDRVGGRMVYVAAPLPPIAGTPEATLALAAALCGLVASAGATILSGTCFSLAGYLNSGLPVVGSAMGGVGRVVVERAIGRVSESAKVLVTDFDNTLWAGVLAEDGDRGVWHQAAGRGYRHFVYQTYLARLKERGTLIAGVTRNSLSVVQPILESGEMVLRADDFVAVLASYHAKSAQIASLATSLNLGLDSFVFVDDNEVEIEEVSRALPAVRCVKFPSREDDLPGFLGQLAAHFAREVSTAEDADRTALYRRRLVGIVPEGASGADIRDFLESLGMRLELTDRSQGDRTRVVQLINKTNQFNLNGRRWSDEEVGEVLARGGRLFGASLSDRSGSHGEIIACLLGPSGIVEAWVMSCRVFQRRVEYGFLLGLLDRGVRPVALRFAATERNEPAVQFLGGLGSGPPSNGLLPFDSSAFSARYRADADLFEARG